MDNSQQVPSGSASVPEQHWFSRLGLLNGKVKISPQHSANGIEGPVGRWQCWSRSNPPRISLARAVYKIRTFEFVKRFVPIFLLLCETLCKRFVALANWSSARAGLVCADNVSIRIFRGSDEVESVSNEGIKCCYKNVNFTREILQRISWRFHQPRFCAASFLRTRRWGIFMSFANKMNLCFYGFAILKSLWFETFL